MYPMYQQNTLLRVNGYEGAKAYQMMPNSVVALFDGNEDIFYVKSSDAGGFSSIKAYKFEEYDPTPTINTEYVTRKEFDELKEIINGKQFISGQSSKKLDDGSVPEVQTGHGGKGS